MLAARLCFKIAFKILNLTFLVLGYDVPALSNYLDFINVMTYDYHGQWDKKTGHFSPMYVHSQDEEKKFNTVSSTSMSCVCKAVNIKS